MTEYENLLDRFRNLAQTFFDESKEVEFKGGNILNVQNAFNGNLAKPRVKDYDQGYEVVGSALDRMVILQKHISNNYGATGCNATVRIQHSIMKPNPCFCGVCRKENKNFLH